MAKKEGLTQEVLEPLTLSSPLLSTLWMEAAILVGASNWAALSSAGFHFPGKLSRPRPRTLSLCECHLNVTFLPLFNSFLHLLLIINILTVLTVMTWTKNRLFCVASGSAAQTLPARHRYRSFVEFAASQVQHRVVICHYFVVEVHQRRIGGQS